LGQGPDSCEARSDASSAGDDDFSAKRNESEASVAHSSNVCACVAEGASTSSRR
jgi:hypothetical protein